MPEWTPFNEMVKRLAAEANVSVNQVGYQAYDPATRGTNPDTFKSAMGGRRRPPRILMERVAEVLGVTPDVFVEYKLAAVREALDESKVGYEVAVSNLENVRADIVLEDGTIVEIKSRTGETSRRAAERLAQRLTEAAAAGQRAREAGRSEQGGRDRRRGRGGGGAA